MRDVFTVINNTGIPYIVVRYVVLCTWFDTSATEFKLGACRKTIYGKKVKNQLEMLCRAQRSP